MKSLLVAEYRDGEILGSLADLLGFAEKAGGDHVMFMVGSNTSLPQYSGKLYLADSAKHGEYNPTVHKQLLLKVVNLEKPDFIVFSHSSYGWDLAPRVAWALKAAQVSEAVAYLNGTFTVPACNAKLRRDVKVDTDTTVVTLQACAFGLSELPGATPDIELVDINNQGKVAFLGYEQAEVGVVDLSKTEVIVSAGRGIGKPENIQIIEALAKALGGEYGASRPVIDAEWAEHARQVGTTGQTVSPKVYFACGISGAIQHVAGMKKSEFVVAINTDKDAPIGDIADVLVVADLKQFIPVLTERICLK